MLCCLYLLPLLSYDYKIKYFYTISGDGGGRGGGGGNFRGGGGGRGGRGGFNRFAEQGPPEEV